MALDANPKTGGYVLWHGINQGQQPVIYGGTSLAAPIMAGFCACINDARVQFGATALGGSFNPLAYSLIDTSAFRDIPANSGSNGAYYTTAGYDEVTGVGAINVATLFHSSVSNNFFANEVELSGQFYYLQFPSNGNVFGYYNYINFPSIYHNEMGYEGLENKQDAQGGVYLYDYKSGHQIYTSPTYPFPYLTDFNLNATLYYYPQSNNPGHYTTNPRVFHNFSTGQDFNQ